MTTDLDLYRGARIATCMRNSAASGLCMWQRMQERTLHGCRYAEHEGSAHECRCGLAWTSPVMDAPLPSAAGPDLREAVLRMGDECFRMDHRGELERLREMEQRVRKLAAEMRGWCSPYGMAGQYADRLEAAIDGTEAT